MNVSQHKMVNCLRKLVSAVSNAALYSPVHRQVTRLCREALHELQDGLQGGQGISLMLVDDRLVCDEEPLGGGLFLDRFARVLHRQGVSHIKILPGVDAEEMRTLVSGLARPRPDTPMESTEHIRLGTVEVRFTVGGQGGGDFPLFADIPAEELASFVHLYEGVRQHRQMNVVGIGTVVASFIDGFKLTGFLDAVKKEADPFLTLTSLHSAGDGSFTHATNVCVLTLAQAIALGIDGALLHDIGIAALLHDIGKAFLPPELMVGRKRRTDVEEALWRQHPVKGATFLLETKGVSRLAAIAAFEHHLNYNQSGFPSVESGWKQHLVSHMVAIADCYDNLRSGRDGQPLVDLEDIAAFMQANSGLELHPKLTDQFLRIIDRAERGVSQSDALGVPAPLETSR